MRQLTADPGFLLSRVGAVVRAGFKEVLAGWGVRPLQYVILLLLDAGGNDRARFGGGYCPKVM